MNTSRIKLILSLFLLCFIISSNTYANTYYVVPTGGNDNNPGTITHPWASWQKGFITAKAGDTVFFRDGVWYPTTHFNYLNSAVTLAPYEIPAIGHDGTDENPICFFNYPGETPILDCSRVDISNKNYNVGIGLYYANYINLRGLTVRNVYQPKIGTLAAGIGASTCTNINYERITVYNIGGRGFSFFSAFGVPAGEGGPKVEIKSDTSRWINCDAYNCADMLSSEPGNGADGWKAQNYPGSCLYFEGCRAWNCTDDGFDPSGPCLVIIKNCWSFANGFPGALDGNGFKSGGVFIDVNDNITRVVTGCLAAFNTGYGYYDLEYASYHRNNARIYNNTFYKNGIGIQISSNYLYPNSLSVYKNNIVYAPTQKDASGRPYLLDVQCFYNESHNTWDYWESGGSLPRFKVADTVTVTDDDFITIDSTGISGPRQADGSLPQINFMKLASGSDLIDKGIDVRLSYYGASPDLGYSEYTSESEIHTIPTYVKSVIENSTPSRLEMTYNLTLANIVPATSTFAVKVNSVARTVSSVTISGTKVLLTLATPVVYGDVVTVAYTKPGTNFLQTPDGGQAASINPQSVINNCSPPANQPPVITITSPAKSISFIAPATITIEASAFDRDGSVTKVEFYNGSTKLGEITSPPYSYNWKNVLEGTYLLYAIATDNSGAKTVSETVTVTVEKSVVTVNELPVVSITYSLHGNSKKPGKHDSIVLSAETYDPDGTIINVEFKCGDSTLIIVNSPPYEYTMENINTGTYIITAIATDNFNASTTSLPIEINVSDISENSDIISLSPNPNNGLFAIDVYSALPGMDKRTIIVNFSGKVIYEDKIIDSENHREFDLSTASPGTYILMISSDNRIITKKFIKR